MAAMVWLLAGLLLVLPAGQHAGAGLLVCIGADGHVDIEDGRWSDCAPEGADLHAPASTTQRAPADGCGDCIDVPIMTSPAEGRAAIVKPLVPAPDVHLTQPAPLVLRVGTFAPVPTVLTPDAPAPSLVGVQTVVLRV